MALTGRFDFRRTFFGKVVLRVEDEVPAFWPRSGERPVKKRWRNAALVDLTAPEMRTLIDLRFRPHLLMHRVEVDRAAAPASNVISLQDSQILDDGPGSPRAG